MQLKGPTKPGTLQDRFFVVRDYKMNGLPRKQLPCRPVEENEKLGYDGGIGKCIHGKPADGISCFLNINILYLLLTEYMEDKMNCKLPWTSGRSKDLENCSTSEHLMHFQALSMSLMYFGEPNYYNYTRCLQPCKYYHFHAKEVMIYVCLVFRYDGCHICSPFTRCWSLMRIQPSMERIKRHFPPISITHALR